MAVQDAITEASVMNITNNDACIINSVKAGGVFSHFQASMNCPYTIFTQRVPGPLPDIPTISHTV